MDKRNVSMSKVVVLIFLVLFIGWGGQAGSQEKYPTRSIDIIVPFSPGGGTDLVNRVMANYLKTKWSSPVNIINKPGGNTVPACVEVYSAKADGYKVSREGSSGLWL